MAKGTQYVIFIYAILKDNRIYITITSVLLSRKRDATMAFITFHGYAIA